LPAGQSSTTTAAPRSAGRDRHPRELSRTFKAAKANQQYAIREVREDLIDVLAGNLGRRVVGLAALVAALLIGVAANVLSAVQ
jgi:hypothetical protein